ncbi:uncharacterized protein I303_103181 [Kwoniella dejecticola CBS 10117]|uniref:Aminoglycoside phosphotransferase domain-containing protein n=1 Tax=Kwoniella dejecticola CBS 10117 TaxID=1296121 RepID=A0A1A6AAV1_9TREE|nr:uncharacterized protein I303_03203 [Kwoniella dejecticola CBS 10117]OBR87179.1 hypothetical protein I303_03203 [Kwoniella dejecticola CBS 10117]
MNQFESLLQHLRQLRPSIEQDAERIREGCSATLSIPIDAQSMVDSKMWNGINIHLVIFFDDGVKWLLRLKQDHGDYPPFEIRHAVLDSEITTLRLLKRAGAAVPNAWMPDSLRTAEAYQDRPLDYFFYEYLSGTALQINRKGPYSLAQPGKRIRRILEGFANTQIAISNAPIRQRLIGSLRSHSSGSVDEASQEDLYVGPLVTYHCGQYVKPPYFPGPFSNNQERYLTLLDIVLQHIENGYLCQHDPLGAYIWHLELRELVETCDMLRAEPAEVFVRHADDKQDIFMGDKKGNTSGIIDWEWAYVTTRAEAFSSPTFAFDRPTFAAGNNKTSAVEDILIEIYMKAGRADLAECLTNGRIYNHLSFIGRFDHTCSPRGVIKAFAATKPFNLNPPINGTFDEDWWIYCIDPYQSNPVVQYLIQKVGWDKEKTRKEVELKKKRSREEFWKQRQR